MIFSLVATTLLATAFAGNRQRHSVIATTPMVEPLVVNPNDGLETQVCGKRKEFLRFDNNVVCGKHASKLRRCLGSDFIFSGPDSYKQIFVCVSQLNYKKPGSVKFSTLCQAPFVFTSNNKNYQVCAENLADTSSNDLIYNCAAAINEKFPFTATSKFESDQDILKNLELDQDSFQTCLDQYTNAETSPEAKELKDYLKGENVSLVGKVEPGQVNLQDVKELVATLKAQGHKFSVTYTITFVELKTLIVQCKQAKRRVEQQKYSEKTQPEKKDAQTTPSAGSGNVNKAAQTTRYGGSGNENKAAQTTRYGGSGNENKPTQVRYGAQPRECQSTAQGCHA